MVFDLKDSCRCTSGGFVWVFEEHFEVTHVLHVHNRVPELHSVLKSTYSFHTSTGKIFGSSLYPDKVNIELQCRVPDACWCNLA